MAIDNTEPTTAEDIVGEAFANVVHQATGQPAAEETPLAAEETNPEEVEDNPQEPQEISSDENFFYTYRTKEDAERGHEEKDRFIRELQTKLAAKEVKRVQQQGIQQPAQQNIQQQPEISMEQYSNQIEDIRAIHGDTAATVKIVQDVIVAQNAQDRARAEAEKVKYQMWAEDIRSKIPGVSNEEIDMMISTHKTVADTNDNPLFALYGMQNNETIKSVNQTNKSEALKRMKRSTGNLPYKKGAPQEKPNIKSGYKDIKTHVKDLTFQDIIFGGLDMEMRQAAEDLKSGQGRRNPQEIRR
jgi:hypothetical protein